MNNKIESIFKGGTTPTRWMSMNSPEGDLIYKSGQANQISNFGSVVSLLGKHVTMRIVGVHHSKSVPLPVACIKFHPYDQVYTYCFIRDNFYDKKLCVISDGPVKLPYSLVYYEKDEEWLEDQRRRYIKNYDGTLSPEREKKVKENDDWYHTDWSGSKLIRKDGRLYVGSMPNKVYCEGISDLDLPDEMFNMYETDAKAFGLSLGTYGQLLQTLEYIERSLESYRSKWLDDGGREKLRKEGKL